MKTFSAKAHEVQRDWFVVDGSGKVLGRLAAEIALRLRGNTSLNSRLMLIPATLLSL